MAACSRQYQIASGVPKAQAYDVTMYVLAGMIALGFLCNLMVRPIADKHFMTDAELAAEKKLAHERAVGATAGGKVGAVVGTAGSNPAVAAFAWAAVGIPLSIGIWLTLQKAVVFFK
jgi:hypothetical protein